MIIVFESYFTLFDLSPEYDKYISFKNGIYNLDTGEFRARDISDRFTEALDWDYSDTYSNFCFDDTNQFFILTKYKTKDWMLRENK